MKAISLWQPWASAMALGLKHIETRHWETRYRGPIAIHAAKRWTLEERSFAADQAKLYGIPMLASPPLGSIVAVGFLERIITTPAAQSFISEMEEDWGNYAPQRFAWMFKDIQPLPEPIPYKGAQGIFFVPDDLKQIPALSLPAPAPPRVPPQRDLFGA